MTLLLSSSNCLLNIDWNDPIVRAAIALLVVGFLTIVALLKFYVKLTCGFYRGKETMDGKIVIVTGATGGIGLYTAKELASKGATVILACRNIQSGEKVKENLIKETKNSNIILKQLDLSSQKSIRNFAEDVNRNFPKLHVLIHNAGTAEAKYSKTEDKLETTMATNHFGPFLLTHLLIDLLKKSAPSRVIVVASELYRLASLNLNKINPESSWIPAYLYYVSKYANICFTKELARRLEQTGVTANCLHPGMIDSGIWRNVPAPLSWGLQLIIKGFFKTPQQGCQTSVFLAVSPEVENVTGKYFMDCKERSLSSGASDMNKAKKLWELSEDYAGLKSTDPHI